MNAGLYVWRDSPDQHGFWKACGIGTLQFCDTHWALRTDRLDDWYAGFSKDVASAKRAGFRVNVILFSNISQWEGPAEREPTGTGVLFDPRDPAAMRKRLESIGRAVRALRGADGFTFVAGDPGGAIGAPFGARTVDDFRAMAVQVREVVRREAPHAAFAVNPWAIAYWTVPKRGCFEASWWREELRATRELIESGTLPGPGCGVEIPGHDLYRPLARRVLREAGDVPETFPRASDIGRLRAKGASSVWAWPYFLLDEADDGDAGPAGRAVQIETRYIRRCVSHLRRCAVDGVMGNWSYAGHLPRALNTYAFGRFVADPRTTPASVIDAWAGAVAGKGRTALGQVLRFIENDSNWHRKLPAEDRLPDLPCRLRTREDALAALTQVSPHSSPPFALPEPPAEILARLRGRLGGVTSEGGSR